MPNYKEKSAQSGRSMIEMLGVLAIVGVLSAGGIAGYSMAMEDYKTTTLIERMNLIVARVQSLYKSGDYTGINRENLIKSGKLTAKDLENPFGGNLSVGVGGGGSHYFAMNTGSNNIPANACVELATLDWNGRRYAPVAIVSEGSSLNSTPYKQWDNGFPSVEEAATACSGGNKRLYWSFY